MNWSPLGRRDVWHPVIVTRFGTMTLCGIRVIGDSPAPVPPDDAHRCQLCDARMRARGVTNRTDSRRDVNSDPTTYVSRFRFEDYE